MFDSKLSRDDRAVSPVVGVILMVAITVILAAVIGAFVLDLGSNQTAPPRAGLSFEEDSGANEITVTVTDPGNIESLSFKGDTGNGVSVSNPPSAGDSYTFSGYSNGASGEIRAIGTNNGQSGVVSTYSFDNL